MALTVTLTYKKNAIENLLTQMKNTSDATQKRALQSQIAQLYSDFSKGNREKQKILALAVKEDLWVWLMPGDVNSDVAKGKILAASFHALKRELNSFHYNIASEVSNNFGNIDDSTKTKNGEGIESYIEDMVEKKLDPLIGNFLDCGWKFADAHYMYDKEKWHFIKRCIEEAMSGWEDILAWRMSLAGESE